MKLMFAVPCNGPWEQEMAHGLALTFADLAANPMQDSLRLMRCSSSKLASNRMELAREAIRCGAHKIVWWDTDIAAKPANVRALLVHDLDIVGVNYARKTPQQESVCSALDGTVLTQGQGVESVAHIGMGLCVTATSVFQRLDTPWFSFQWNPETQDDIGEDVFFCRKARAAGMEVHVDHDASVGIKHIGRFPFVVQQ